MPAANAGGGRDVRAVVKIIKDSHVRQSRPDPDLGFRVDGLRDHTLVGPLWEGYHESRRCSRDTHPESYITKYDSIRRERGGVKAEGGGTRGFFDGMRRTLAFENLVQ